MLALYARLIHELTGRTRIPILFVLSNRYSREIESSVGCYFQDGIAILNVEKACDFQALARVAARGLLQAMGNSRFDPSERRSIEVSEVVRRGASVDCGIIFNYSPNDSAAEGIMTIEPGISDLEIQCETAPGISGLGLDVFESDQSLELTMSCDLLLLPAEGALEVAKQIVESLEGLANGNEPFLDGTMQLSSMLPSRDRKGWIEVRENLVNSSALIEFIFMIPDVSEVAVFPSPCNRLLEAFVVSTSPNITPSFLHQAVLDRVKGYAIMTPDIYTICRERPNDIHSREEWYSCHVVRWGNGKDEVDVPGPVSVATDKLAQIVQQHHTDLQIDMTRSYSDQGCHLLRSYSIVQRLKNMGYSGIDVYDLDGPASLHYLSRKLVPR